MFTQVELICEHAPSRSIVCSLKLGFLGVVEDRTTRPWFSHCSYVLDLDLAMSILPIQNFEPYISATLLLVYFNRSLLEVIDTNSLQNVGGGTIRGFTQPQTFPVPWKYPNLIFFNYFKAVTPWWHKKISCGHMLCLVISTTNLLFAAI